MCGIFGFISKKESEIDFIKLAKTLGDFSESRGKDASGLATNNPLFAVKSSENFNKAMKSSQWQKINQNLLERQGKKSVIVIGHTRLATNGDASVDNNNQPVVLTELIGVHNGIICNTNLIESDFNVSDKISELDSEILFKALRNEFKEELKVDSNRLNCWEKSLNKVYSEIEGAASIAAISDKNELILATNIGSLYVYESKEILVFSSERITLEDTLKKFRIEFGKEAITQLKPNSSKIVNIDNSIFQTSIDLKETTIYGASTCPIKFELLLKSNFSSYINSDFHKSRLKRIEERQQSLIRCSNCLIPETHPFVVFDKDGVCNHCKGYTKIKYFPEKELYNIADGLKKKYDGINCIIPLSGGRDSVYVLHLAKTVLGLNPVAYTYDWGLVTDLARRNQSRVCQALGIEHIVISADIAKKRKNVRMNVEAWLKRPDLGIIPLFMAGDKMFFTHADELRKRLNIDAVLFGMTEFENNDFKEGFCGVDRTRFGEDGRFYHMSSMQQVKMIGHYLGQFASNSGYINSSMIDTIKAYYAYYISDHNYILPYKYFPWDEKTIEETIIKNYNFELSPDTDSSWRIGDGTASFYNYIYYSLAGFSESEPMRSNQIREGQITREEGLFLSQRDNKPRYESFSWYCETIGLDPVNVMRRIDEIPFVENRWK
jgi:glucosamine--fructose-6-phosphate aminotransferase (isomerizing)